MRHTVLGLKSGVFDFHHRDILFIIFFLMADSKTISKIMCGVICANGTNAEQ